MATNESPDAGKSPAFQFYPKDFLSDENVRMMSMAERGVYITLLSLCWIEGSLPSDVERLALLVGVPVTAFRKLWPALAPCFRANEQRPDRLVHQRLEKEREKQAEFKRRQSDKGKAGMASRWRAEALPDDNRAITTAITAVKPMAVITGDNSSSLSSSLSADCGLKTVSSEALTRSEPVALTFPVIGSEKPTWALTERQITEWERLFPGVPILAECRKALAWVQANQRKTAKGMPKFLTAWLTRAVDSPRSASQAGGMGTRTIALVNATAGFLAGSK
jgi:uncharacterized protein YdaU (DUF1376 family)